jgi:CubicO group peptidase (beta-lactamase class C family)
MKRNFFSATLFLRAATLRTATRSLVAASFLFALTGCSTLRVDKVPLVASSLASHLVCSGTFVSGLDPDRTYNEVVRPMQGMGLVNWGLRYRVDRATREVTTTVAGAFESRAVFRDQLGCVVLHDGETVEAPGPLQVDTADTLAAAVLPDIARSAIVQSADARMQAALARAFDEPEQAPFHQTRAVVVLRDGKVIAERYAPGISIDTPLLGWSLTKSVTNALVGILVRQGRLDIRQPAPISAWSDLSDPRHAITTEHLLRQTSGLDIPETHSGFDLSTRIMFLEHDKAAAAAGAKLAAAPGTLWYYSDPQYMVLSRIVRDAVGGRAGDVLRFARRELFGPLGMRHTTLEFDATGTPMGATSMYASARDWARFGQLYLNGGMAGAQRILPEGWVSDSVTASPETGYGAGFFTNRLDGMVPGWGVPWGMRHAPHGTFFARGYMGQYVVIVPSERLVVVRMSASHVRGDDIETTDALMGGVLEALRGVQ